ncbi:succinate dehydrogenase hydrophobic membrane anchor subunit [Halorussus gelatinilyticus]|uniref:Succinate dehydrogenase hydrophobic membrane anchor subunit n=1 Tax=Halorussus gelatinilyticus TaxID=2937524 RepID=A0A8U0II75_9EURY|nr:succinate dehydrogenase hydrophobic membrane anchor subunit [Halorussus gelatinilyticus]UPW00386.1 succinate dehydrogenase hydrophobic membrane anchor subunit [Halorussus gelatinilyticus]
MAERYSSFQSGSASWLFQRVTAAFLVVVLAFHFFLLHFMNHASEVTFAGTSARMSEWGYLVTMVLFLWTGTFHGVNGVYAALLNQGLTGTKKTAVKGILVVAGLALAAQGTYLALVMNGMV